MKTKHKRKFDIEREITWGEEQCPVTKKWSMTKKVLLNTYAVIEWVKPSDNPQHIFQNEYPIEIASRLSKKEAEDMVRQLT